MRKQLLVGIISALLLFCIGYAESAFALNPNLRQVVLAPSLENQVKAILRRSGGSFYLPSPSTCFTDSAGTTPCAVDDPVGKLLDLIGTNHATQGTAGFKPILRGKVKNLLTYSQDFSNAAWVKTNGTTVKSTGVADPFGTNNATTINSPAINALLRHAIGQQAGVTVTFSVWLRAASNVSWAIQDSSNAFVLRTSKAINITTQWQRFSHTVTVTSSTDFIGLGGLVVGSFPSPTSDIDIYGAQLEIGSTANEYIPTTTAPKSSSYGPYWADPDATDDALTISNLSTFTSATVIISQQGVGQTTLTGQNISAGYSYNQARSNGLMLIPGTVSDSDLAKLQKYMNRLAGV
jgi:hypothetical protein